MTTMTLFLAIYLVLLGLAALRVAVSAWQVFAGEWREEREARTRGFEVTMKRLILAVLCAGMVGAAPVPTEDAARRMQERQTARQATLARPAQITIGEVETLQLKIRQLEAENAALKKKLLLVEAKAATKPAEGRVEEPPESPQDRQGVQVGWTEKQVDDYLKRNGISLNRRTSQRLERGKTVNYVHWTVGGLYEGYSRIEAVDGKIVEVEH